MHSTHYQAQSTRFKGSLFLIIAFALSATLWQTSGAPAPRTATDGVPAPGIVRFDKRFDQLVPKDAVIEKVADGFSWVEGPVWNRSGNFLLFSDVPNNRIVKWKQDEGTSDFLQRSGYTGNETFAGREPGSNGLAFDSEGRLVFCQHGDRSISRLENDGRRTTLAGDYMGKRINSPNDVIFKSNGDMYFTHHENHFMRFEVWRNADDLEVHKATPHIKASFDLRRRQGWTTEITPWIRVKEDKQSVAAELGENR